MSHIFYYPILLAIWEKKSYKFNKFNLNRRILKLSIHWIGHHFVPNFQLLQTFSRIGYEFYSAYSSNSTVHRHPPLKSGFPFPQAMDWIGLCQFLYFVNFHLWRSNQNFNYTWSGRRNTIFPSTMTLPDSSNNLANSAPCSLLFPQSSTQIRVNSE